MTEPTIQEYNLGTNQILVELPGVDDLSRVRDIIQSTARLEIHQVVGGPFPTEEAAAQSLGGTVPPEDEVMAYGGTEPELMGQYYRSAAARRGMPATTSAMPSLRSMKMAGRMPPSFSRRNAGDRFYQFTSTNIGKSLAVVLEQPGAGGRQYPAGHPRPGPDYRSRAKKRRRTFR